MSDDDDDDRLVREFLLDGRIDAFEELVRRHQRPVFRVAMSILGPGREMEAEDVTQEAFLQVYRKLRGFERRSRFSTWLYRITYRRAVDRVRARREPHARETADSGPEVADLLRDRAIRDCISRLPDPQRAAVHLHYWLGHTVDETSTLLATRPGTVKSWLFRARASLAACLTSKGVRW